MDIPTDLSESAARWYRQGDRYQHRGQDIYYRSEGSGEALLLIHGFPTCSWDWEGQWLALAKSYRCITADMIGFGCSAKPRDHDYSIHDQTDLFEGLLRQLGVERLHILAHDYGDSVAQEMLARHLDRQAAGDTSLVIRSLCLLNGGLFPETHRARPVQKLLNSPLGPLICRLMNRRNFGAGLASVFGPNTPPDSAQVDDFWRLYRHRGGIAIGHKLIRYMRDRRRHRERWVGALQQAGLPIRLINGPQDPVSGRHMTERYRELVPDPDIVLLEGIGHYPQIEAPQAVLAAYREFLQGRVCA